jgi:hypothetical protein
MGKMNDFTIFVIEYIKENQNRALRRKFIIENLTRVGRKLIPM